MRLSALLEALPAPARSTSPAGSDPVIRGVCYDSRAVSPGDLFVALRGSGVDGHDYLAEAIRLGAAAVLVEELPKGVDLGDRPAVRVRDTRAALAPIACRFFGDPAAELTLIGVTGTNGKTSTTYLVESILAAGHRQVGVIGTVEVRYAGEHHRTPNTTPESLDLQRTLRAMRTRSVEFVAMEVSSHGIALGRVAGCRFPVAALTNVTQDHLDFHGTMERYRDAKTDLFRNHLDARSTAVVNVDDPAAPGFLAAAREAGARTLGVSRRDPEADVLLLEAEVGREGSQVRLRGPAGELALRLPLVGDFNLENLLVATGVAVALGVDPDTIAAGVAACPQVPGRIERVGAEIPGAPHVLVDYAHTPDAVDKLLRTVRPLCQGRLITLFGCGGDRDRAKRPLMAQAVARHSDRVVATSDNPRTEDPRAILADVEGGLTGLARVEAGALDRTPGGYAVVIDRREAIELAVRIAGPSDTVVLAGKGHEDYQIIGRERFPFDDRVVARDCLRKRELA
jgi:UDP-N-acetylmuramoyl-L-alanyl-D-glutamate--2,6-diaminopimelate ligase